MSDTGEKKDASDRYKMFSGYCPDEQCKATLFFPAYDSCVECTKCGQRHSKSLIKNVAEVTNPEIAVHNILKNIILGTMKPKKNSDTVKVLGISNYQCKILSPLLTKYGMDKQSGEAKLLSDMDQPSMFDCAVLADRSFLIEPEHVDIEGFGRDKTASAYLSETLAAISQCNEGEERLTPIHADGDGHCLVHAVSRALVGRELFWHALRENLRQHFVKNLDTYKAHFTDFVDKNEWGEIIKECDPTYVPEDGEPMGLRNLHIFGLANVLHRPIVLLDSLSGIQSSGDYTGVFLPGFVPAEQCRGKDGTLHRPLCLAWSSHARNHYIALVPVKGRALPRLPSWMTPKPWGMPHSELPKYIDLDEQGAVTLCGNKCLQDRYILRLAEAMEGVFRKTHGVSTSLVADVQQYVFKTSGMVGTQPELVIAAAERGLADKTLYRCLTCDALTQWKVTGLKRGGELYQLAVDSHGPLNPSKNYSFPMQGLICAYEAEKDTLVPRWDLSKMTSCQWCQGSIMRRVKPDGSPEYENGDRTSERAPKSRCHCGYKHYWEGRLYDNKPEQLVVPLDWGGKQMAETVAWFQFESDPSLNSNVYEVAQQLVHKHFPGEFGSERLVQKVVDTILALTAQKSMVAPAPEASNPEPQPQESVPSKIILTGQQRQAVHKEELGKSETEKRMRDAIQAKAPLTQKRKTGESSGAAKPCLDTNAPLDSAACSSPRTAPVAEKHPKTSEPTVIESKPLTTEVSNTSKQRPESLQPESKSQSNADTPKSKKVKVSTNNGRQLVLTLEERVTYSSLANLLSQELTVPKERMRIKNGYPPTLLSAPPEGTDPQFEPEIQVNHGDKLSVEIIPDPSEPVARTPDNVWPVVPEEPSHSWSHFDPVARETSAQQMLKSLQDMQDTKSDSIDTSIASLLLMATLQQRDVWTMLQTMPHLFSVGGLFYEQVKKDVGLTHGKHYTLQAIPGKVFRYDETHNRLELCLEPHGHFQVAPGIEHQVLNQSLINIAHSAGLLRAEGGEGAVPRELGLGSHGVAVGGATKTHGKPQLFQGQGHTLSSPMEIDSHMPKELSPVTNRKRGGRTGRFRKLSTGSREDSIEEMDESTDSEISLSASNSDNALACDSPGFPRKNSSGSSPSMARKAEASEAVTDGDVQAQFSALSRGLEALIEDSEETQDMEET